MRRWAAIGLCACWAVGGGAPLPNTAGPAYAADASVTGAGVDLIASVDEIFWAPAGNRLPSGVPFAHGADVGGRYSVTVSGAPIQEGIVTAGFIVGCGVSASGGVSVGLSPNQSLTVAIAPAPGVSVGAGVSESLSITLTPGQVAPMALASAPMNSRSEFPYSVTVNHAALDVGQCMSPVSAVPFVSASVTTATGTVQTAAYGDQFTF
ncbi:MspA family porin [Nocardia sp. CDC159]|uniref:MspA family porin n=1 Tax=Nocardia pulmonis TaxID=2951408 RepID=A0A9X2E5C5_9NOCA|nr:MULTISPECIES: MspA family porin [Nocardia]MCM6771901.1 MspA family porin [Nocardia pulmonis]MCM6785441.1 MspA family porin [Nocardia sp. CDC159]